jgi:hypothetical protein
MEPVLKDSTSIVHYVLDDSLLPFLFTTVRDGEHHACKSPDPE